MDFRRLSDLAFKVRLRRAQQANLSLLIFAEFSRTFGGNSAKIPAEWVAGSAEWVAGSAVKLGIFSDFWRGASARAKNRKKCLKKFGGIFGGNAAEFWQHFGAKINAVAMFSC